MAENLTEARSESLSSYHFADAAETTGGAEEEEEEEEEWWCAWADGDALEAAE